MRLTATHIKELQKLRPDVAGALVALQRRWHLRKVTMSSRPSGYQLYMGEGEDITFFTPTGNVRQAKMVTESSIGAANDGLNYAVGQRPPPLPEGTWIIIFTLTYGPAISILYIGIPQLG